MSIVFHIMHIKKLVLLYLSIILDVSENINIPQYHIMVFMVTKLVVICLAHYTSIYIIILLKYHFSFSPWPNFMNTFTLCFVLTLTKGIGPYSLMIILNVIYSKTPSKLACYFIMQTNYTSYSF